MVVTIKEMTNRVIDFLEARGIDYDHRFVGGESSLFAFIPDFKDGKEVRIRLKKSEIVGGTEIRIYLSNKELTILFDEILPKWNLEDYIYDPGYDEVFLDGEDLVKTYQLSRY